MDYIQLFSRDVHRFGIRRMVRGPIRKKAGHYDDDLIFFRLLYADECGLESGHPRNLSLLDRDGSVRGSDQFELEFGSFSVFAFISLCWIGSALALSFGPATNRRSLDEFESGEEEIQPFERTRAVTAMAKND